MKKLLYISFLTFHFSLFTFDVISQPSITWQRNYDNRSGWDNEGSDICQSSTGTYFVVGRSGNAEVIKINDYGDSLWSKLYTSVEFWPTSCVATSDNGLIMVGERGGNSRVKLDVNGGIIWNIPNDSFECEFYEIIKTSDNNYVACGSASTPIIGYIMKFDSLGQLIWDKYYSTAGYMRFYNITEAYSNGFLVCGVENDNINPANQGLIIRIDSAGNEIWRKYPMPSLFSQSCNSVRKFLNNYVLIGGSDSTRVIKIDTFGNTIYQKLFPKPQGTVSWSSSEIRGEVYRSDKIILYRNQSSLNNSFTTITKLDSIFNQINSARLDFNNGFTSLRSCLPLSNNDILFAGSEDIYAFGANFDFYVVRMDSALYSPLLPVVKLENQVPVYSSLEKNYPNPFNPDTRIRFSLNERSNIVIKIHNILGQEITTLVNKILDRGTYEVLWNAGSYTSGIYYCSMMVNEQFNSALKLSLIK